MPHMREGLAKARNKKEDHADRQGAPLAVFSMQAKEAKKERKRLAKCNKQP